MWKKAFVTSLTCFSLGFEILGQADDCYVEYDEQVKYTSTSQFSSCESLDMLGVVPGLIDAPRFQFEPYGNGTNWTFGGSINLDGDADGGDTAIGELYIVPGPDGQATSLEVFGGLNMGSNTDSGYFIYGSNDQDQLATGKLILSGSSNSTSADGKIYIGGDRDDDRISGFVSIGKGSNPFGENTVYVVENGSRLLVTDTITCSNPFIFKSYVSSPNDSNVHLDVAPGVTFTASGVFEFQREDDDEYCQVNRQDEGGGTVILSTLKEDDLYIQNVQINKGVLEININPEGSGRVAVGEATLRFGSSMNWKSDHQIELYSLSSVLDDGGNEVTVDALVSDKTYGATEGDGRLNKIGSGTLTLTNTNTYSKGTYLKEGRLAISSPAQINASTYTSSNGLYLYSSTVLEVTGSLTLGIPINLIPASGASSYSGTISIADGKVFTLSGSEARLIGSGGVNDTLTIQDFGTFKLNTATADFLGSYVLLDSTLEVSNNAGINKNFINLNGGTLKLSGGNLEIGTLIASGDSFVSLGSYSLTVNNSGDNFSDASISGTGQVFFKGTGSIDLKGAASTYSGGTDISGGLEIYVDAGDNLGTGPITLGSGCLLGFSFGADATITQPVTLGGACKINAASATGTISGIISGSGGSLEISGRDGFLTLSGDNNYTGNTTIKDAIVSISLASSFGSSTTAISLTNGGVIATNTLTLPNTRAINLEVGTSELSAAEGKIFTIEGAINGSGGVDVAGPGITILKGTNTFSGQLEITGGTLQVGADSNLGASGGEITLDGGILSIVGGSIDSDRGFFGINGQISVDSGYEARFSGPCTVTKSDSTLVKIGAGVAGVLPLTPPLSTFIPFVIVSGGSLETNTYVTSGSAISVAAGTKIVFKQKVPGSYSGSQTNGGLSGAGSLEVRGDSGVAFTLDTVTVPNTYTGDTILGSGILAISTDVSLGGSPKVIGRGGSLQTTLTTTSQRPVSLEASLPFIVNEAAVFIERGTISKVTGFTGGVIKQGPGTLVLSPESGSNTYEGGTTLEEGVVQVSFDKALGRDSGLISPIIGKGGTLLISGSTSFSTSRPVTFESGYTTTFDIGGDLGADLTLTLNGAMGSSGGFIKSGEGKLVLTSNNTNSGGTTVSAGSLAFKDTNGYIGGSITVELGATFEIATSSNLSAGTSIILNSGTLSAVGDYPKVTNTPINFNVGGGLISVDKDRTLELSGILSGNGVTLQEGVNGPGTLILSGTTSTYTGTTTIDGGTLQIASELNLGLTSSIILRNNEDDAILKITTPTTITKKIEDLDGTIDVGSNAVTFTGTLKPSTLAVLEKIGTGMLTFSPSSVTGSLPELKILEGSLTGNTTLLGNTKITLSSGSNSLIFADTKNGTYSGTTQAGISGGGNVEINASADDIVVTFAPIYSTGNNYTGSTTLTRGILAVSKDSDFGATGGSSLGLIGSGGTLQATATFTSNRLVSLTTGKTTTFKVDKNQVLTLNKTISGGGTLAKTGSGVLQLKWDGITPNSYTGGTLLTEGSIEITSDNLGTGTITGNGGTLSAPTASVSLMNLVTLNDGKTTTFFIGDGQSDTLTLNGVLSGAGSLLKQGLGILALKAINTHTGIITIESGEVSLTAGSSLSAFTVQTGAIFSLGTASGLAPGSSFTFTGGTFEPLVSATVSSNMSFGSGGAIFSVPTGLVLTLSGILSGDNAFTLPSGSSTQGTVVLSGVSNTYKGGVSLLGGTLQISSGGSLGTVASSSVVLNGGILKVTASTTISQDLSTLQGTLDVDGLNSVTFNGKITAASGVTLKKIGTGTAIFSPSSVGVTSLPILNLEVGSVQGNTSLFADSEIDLSDGTTMIFNQTTAGTYRGSSSQSISGAGSINIQGTSGVVLTFSPKVAPTYTGSTILTSGTLSISSSSYLGSSLGGITGSGGTLETTATMTSSKAISLTGSSKTIFSPTQNTTLTLTGGIGGTGGLIKEGKGILNLNPGSTVVSTYEGGTTLQEGILQIKSDAALGNLIGGIIGSGGTLQVITSSFTSARNASLTAGTVTTFDTGAYTLTYTGAITGDGALSKAGTGTLDLQGANSFTGGTTLTAGTVSIIAGNGLSTGALTFNGGTLSIKETLSLSNPVVFTKQGLFTITSGKSVTSVGVLSGTGGFSLTGGTLILQGANTYTGVGEVKSGTLEVSTSSSLGASTSSLSLNGSGTVLKVNSATDVSFSQAVEMKTSTTIEVVAHKASFSGSITPSSSVVLSKTGAGALSMLPTTNSIRSIGTLDIKAGSFIGNSYNLSTSIVTTASGTTLSFSQGAGVSGSYGGGSSSISGSGAVIIAGASDSVLTFQGSNTFTGGLTLTSGTLSISSDNRLGGSTVAISGNGGILETTANFTISRSLSLSGSTNTTIAPSGPTLTWSGVISGDGGLIKDGGGDLVLAGVNTYKGGTTFQGAGALKVASDTALGDTTGSIIGNGGTLSATATFTSSRSLILNRGKTTTLSVDSGKVLTLNGVISDQAGTSGAGVLNKLGAGTLVLGNSANTNTGGVTITAGDISISQASQFSGVSLKFAGGALSTTGSMTFAKGITFDSTGSLKVTSGTTLTLSGVLAGLKGFSMTGGTVILSNTNTYQGNTEVVSGTLQFSGDSNLGNSILSDTAAVGAVVLSGGTLNILGDISSVRGFQGCNGTVNVNTYNVSYSGVVSSNIGSKLTKEGSGRLSLIPSTSSISSSSLLKLDIKEGSFTGNSYSLGNTEITTSTTTGVVTEIAFNQNVAGTFSGSTSGNGSFRMQGASSGVLTVNGKQEFAGNLYLEGGVYSVSNDNSLGKAGGKIYAVGTFGKVQTTASFSTDRDVLFDAATITMEVINGRSETTWTFNSSLIQGNALSKAGDGTLKLNGTVNVSTISVNGGTLYVNGVVQSSTGSSSQSSTESFSSNRMSSAPPICKVVVNRSGGLVGGGIIAGDVFSYGFIAPGDQTSESSLTVEGNVSMFSGSVFLDDISPNNCSHLDVGGVFSIAPNVTSILVPRSGIYKIPENLSIITAAGGVTGQFVSMSIPEVLFMSAVANYSDPFSVGVTVTPLQIFSEVTGRNADAVATSLDNVIDWNRLNVSFTLPLVDTVSNALLPGVLRSLMPLASYPNKMTNTLNKMQPAALKGLVIAQESASIEVRGALSSRMQNALDTKSCYALEDGSCKDDTKRVHIWLSGMGNVLNQKSNTYNHSPQVGYQSKLVGTVAGVDAHFLDYFYAGALGGYTNSHINWKENRGHGDVNTGYGGLYLSFLGEMFYGNASIIGGWSSYNTTRNIFYPGVHETAKGQRQGRELLSHIDTGINLGFSGFTVRPFDSFDYLAGVENSYEETGARDWNLRIRKSNAIMLRNELGLQFAGCVCVKESKWTVSPKVSWVREVRVKGSHYRASFAGASEFPFTVTGYFPSRNLFSPGLMIAGTMYQDRLGINFTYDGEFTGGYSAHKYTAEARFGF